MPGIILPVGSVIEDAAGNPIGGGEGGGGLTWFSPDPNPIELDNGEAVQVTHDAVSQHRMAVSAFKLIPPPDGGYAIPPTPTILGSGEYGPWVNGTSGAYQGQHAFDRTALTWLGDRSSVPQWIAVDLTEALTVVKVRIRKTNQNDNYNPNKFKIQYNSSGLADTEPWIDVIDTTATGVTYTDDWWEDATISQAGRFWRLWIQEGINGLHADGYGCGEFELYVDDAVNTIDRVTIGGYGDLTAVGVRRISDTVTEFRNQTGATASFYLGVGI